MHSRAYLLLEREFEQYEKDKIFGISVTPVGDSLMELIGEIKGLKDTLWEGAELQLSLRYSENYNRVPPSINFNTIPFHPNVDPHTGKPCLDFLDDPTKWDPDFTMTNILLSIQVLLSDPVLENAVNLEAANLLQKNYPQYRQKVLQCVRTSQHLEAIASSYERSAKLVKFFHPVKEHIQPRMTAISYEDYYLRWFTLATSKAAEDFKSPVFEDPNFIANRYGWNAENITKGDWDEITHQLLITELIERGKREKMTESKESHHGFPTPTPETASKKSSSTRFAKKIIDEDEDQWENEVEDLVLWSTTLDESKWD